MAHDEDTPAHDQDEVEAYGADSPRVVPARAPRPIQRRSPVAEPVVAEPVVGPPADEPTPADPDPADPDPVDPAGAWSPVAEPIVSSPPPSRAPQPRPAEPYASDPYAIDLSDADLEPEPLPTAPPERPRTEVPAAEFWGDDFDDPRPSPFSRLQRRRDEEEDAQPQAPRRRRFGRRPSDADDDFVPGEWSPRDWLPSDVPEGQWGPLDASGLAPDLEVPQPAVPEAAEPPAPPTPPAPPLPEALPAPSVAPRPPLDADLTDGFDPDLEPDDDLADPEPERTKPRRGLFRRSRDDEDSTPAAPAAEPETAPEPIPEPEPVPEPAPEPEPEPVAEKPKKPSRQERKQLKQAEAEAAAAAAAAAAPPPVEEAPTGRRARKEEKQRLAAEQKAAKERAEAEKKAFKARGRTKRGAGEAEEDVRRRLYGTAPEPLAPDADPMPYAAPPVYEPPAAAVEPVEPAPVQPEPYEPAPVEPEPYEPAPVEPESFEPQSFEPQSFEPGPVAPEHVASEPTEWSRHEWVQPEPVTQDWAPDPEPDDSFDPTAGYDPAAGYEFPADRVVDEPTTAEPEAPLEPEPAPEPARITRFDEDEHVEAIELDDLPPAAPAPEPEPAPVDPSTLTQSSGLIATFLVALAAIVAALGLAVFWPVDVPAPPAAAGTTAERVVATVDSVETIDCPAPGDQEAGVPPARSTCGTVAVTGTDGTKFGFTVDSTQFAGGFRAGDRVVAQKVDSENGTTYTFVDYERKLPLVAVGLVVTLLTLVGLRWRGVRTLAAVGIALAALIGVVLPAMRDGASPLFVALSAAVLIGLLTLYLVHGFSRRTTAAALGLVVGLALTAVFGLVATRIGLTSGIGTDDGRRMLFLADRIDPAQVTMAAAVLAALGVLIDLTSRQAAATWDIRTAEPTLSAAETQSRSFAWAREHQTGTLLILVFAFVGAGLTGLLVASAGQPGPVAVLASEPVATELLRAAVCAVGAALAVPITGWIASRMAPHAAAEPEPSAAARLADQG